MAFAFFTAVSISAAPAVLANDDITKIKSELKFIGNVNDQPVFHLTLDNASAQEFTVVIRDEYSNVLYRYSSREDNFSKKFMLNTAEIGNDALRFEISSGKNQKPVVYEINLYSRVTDEVRVSKLP